MDLRTRSTRPELMDDADVPPDLYARCLADLASVNRITFTHRPTLRWLKQVTRRIPADQEISILDVASGHGDLLRAIRRWGERSGRRLRLAGIDLNPRSAVAAAAATPPGPGILWQTGDVFGHFPDPAPDFIVTSQFTHHLPDDDVIRFLRWIDGTAMRGWFIADLHRHALAYYGFPIMAWLARWERIVRLDGTVSIARSFRSAEWRRLLAAAGIAAEVKWRLPFRWCVSRPESMIFPRTMQNVAAVAAHYDSLDRFYREIWGEHVHHGLWTTGRETPAQAVTALVDKLADRLALRPGMALCDIGCGYGATARLLAREHQVRVTGVTVSAAQAAAAPMAEDVSIAVQDWLANDFPDDAFDRVYSVESSEHMVDKAKFFAEAFRTLKPGGKLAIYAWLSADAPRRWQVRHLLEPICREGRLPGMGDESDYRALAAAAGFRLAGIEDLSTRVSRTWWICGRRVVAKLFTDRRYARFLLDATAQDRVFALTLMRLIVAYRVRAMRYCLFVFDRPQAQ